MEDQKRKGEAFRGEVISKSVMIETFLSNIISYHFCRDEDHEQEMVHAMLSKDRMMMSFKAEIVGFILTHHLKDFLKKHPRYIKNLSAVISIRNMAAHWHIFPTDNTAWFTAFRTDKHKTYEDEVEITPDYIKSFKSLSDIVLEQTDEAFNALMYNREVGDKEAKEE